MGRFATFKKLRDITKNLEGFKKWLAGFKTLGVKINIFDLYFVALIREVPEVLAVDRSINAAQGLSLKDSVMLR